MKVVFQLLLAASVGLITTNAALAQDFPRTGSVYNESESNYLTYECEMLNSLEMKCSFIQTMVIKPSEEEIYKNFNQDLSRCEAEFSAAGALEKAQKMCADLPLLIGLYDGSISREEAQSIELFGKKLSAQDTAKFFDRPKEIKEMDAAEMLPMSRICGSGTPADICQVFLDATNKLELRTCKVSSNKFEQSFSRLSSENTVWTVRDSASGECGIINVSRFEKDSDYLWRYISQKVVTNPSATVAGNMKCSEFDQRVVTFGWKHNGYAKNCEFIKFGF